MFTGDILCNMATLFTSPKIPIRTPHNNASSALRRALLEIMMCQFHRSHNSLQIRINNLPVWFFQLSIRVQSIFPERRGL